MTPHDISNNIIFDIIVDAGEGEMTLSWIKGCLENRKVELGATESGKSFLKVSDMAGEVMCYYPITWSRLRNHIDSLDGFSFVDDRDEYPNHFIITSPGNCHILVLERAPVLSNALVELVIEFLISYRNVAGMGDVK